MAAESTVILKSSDGEFFEVEEGAACLSEIVKKMIDDIFTEEKKRVIPLPNVSSKILSIVIEFCKRQYNFSKINGAEDNKSSKHELDNWNAEFIKLHNDNLFHLVQASHYLDIKHLFKLTCNAIADKIRGKTPEEIRRNFGMKNDFSAEEEEKILNENKWAL